MVKVALDPANEQRRGNEHADLNRHYNSLQLAGRVLMS